VGVGDLNFLPIMSLIGRKGIFSGCCNETSVVDPNSFFRIRIHTFFSDSDPYTNILTRNFLKWCLSFFFVFWNLYDREKSFPTEKFTFFLFQVFDLPFFTKFVILQQCWIRAFFGFGSSQNIRILSDSDPQHWMKRCLYLYFHVPQPCIKIFKTLPGTVLILKLFRHRNL
jgi:hypothetical protein